MDRPGQQLLLVGVQVTRRLEVQNLQQLQFSLCHLAIHRVSFARQGVFDDPKLQHRLKVVKLDDGKKGGRGNFRHESSDQSGWERESLSNGELKHEQRARVKQAFACFALLLLGLLLSHGGVLIGSDVIAGGDMVNYFIPIREAQLRTGWFVGWHPETFSGIPLMGDIQMGLFYPLNWLHLLGFSVADTMSWLLLLHLMIGGMGFYFLLRGRLGFVAAALGAYIWTFSAYQQLRIATGILPFSFAFAWVPWIILAAEKQSLRGRGLLWCGLLGLFGGLQLVIGAVQVVQITWVGAAIWTLGRLALPREEESRPAIAGGFVIAGLLALLMAAPTLAAALEFQREAYPRGTEDPWRFVSDGSLPWLGLWTWFFPEMFGPGNRDEIFYVISVGFHEFNAFVGALPVVLALFLVGSGWGLVSNWRSDATARNDARILATLLALGLFGFLVGLGANGFLFRFLVSVVPTFDYFRVPGRWVLWLVFAVSFAAAWGMQLLLERTDDKRTLRIWAIAAGVVVVFALVVQLFVTEIVSSTITDPSPGARRLVELYLNYAGGSVGWFLFMALVAGLLGVVLLLGKLSPRIVVVLLFSVLMLDLLKFWIPFKAPIPDDATPPEIETEDNFHRISSDVFEDYFFPQSPAVQWLQQNAEGRFHYSDMVIGFAFDQFARELLKERPAFYGLETTRGYHQLMLKSYVDEYYSSLALQPGQTLGAFLSSGSISNRLFLDAYNVSHVLTYLEFGGAAGFAEVGLSEYTVISPAGLVAFRNPGARGWAWISDSGEFLSAEPDSSLGTLEISERHPDRWSGTVRLSAPGWLHLSSPDYSGFRLTARLDGQLVEGANSRSVYLPSAGDWTFERVFVPAAFRPLPLGLCLLALLGSLGLIVVGFQISIPPARRGEAASTP